MAEVAAGKEHARQVEMRVGTSGVGAAGRGTAGGRAGAGGAFGVAFAAGAFAFDAALLVDVPAFDPTAAFAWDAASGGLGILASSSPTTSAAAGPSGDEDLPVVPLSGRVSCASSCSPASSPFVVAPVPPQPVPALASMVPTRKIC